MSQELNIELSFQQVFVHLRLLTEISQLFISSSSQDERTTISIAQREKTAENLAAEYKTEEVKLISSIIHMVEETEKYLTIKKLSSKAIHMIRVFKPFKIACDVVGSRNSTTKDYHINLYATDESGDQGSIAETISIHLYEGRLRSQTTLASDILQYWEILLRHHTEIECADFCNGLRKTLSLRIETELRHGSLLKRFPDVALAETISSPSIEAITKDISDRLDRIVLHLEQIDALQLEFRGHPSSDYPQTLKRQRLLLKDEVSVVLSELVHLSDNLQKWLVSNELGKKDLRTVQNSSCYRVASCFVNTLKHGIRGRNKMSAVADYEIVFIDKEEIHSIDWIINYAGNDWQASTLIDDLLQAWEIFIRYYTSIEPSDFQRGISTRFSSRKALSTYSAEVDETVANSMMKTFNERQSYEI